MFRFGHKQGKHRTRMMRLLLCPHRHLSNMALRKGHELIQPSGPTKAHKRSGLCWWGSFHRVNCIAGLFSSFFGSKSSIKSVRVLEPSTVQRVRCAILGNGPLGSSPHLQIFPISCVYFINNYRGKKGPEWDHVSIVEQKKENLQVQHNCRVVQILSSSKML